MKMLKMLLLICLGCAVNGFAQKAIIISNGCSSDWNEIGKESFLMTFEPSDEVIKMVNNILEVTNAQSNFELRFISEYRTLATINGLKRYLLYPNSLLTDTDHNYSYWESYFLLAHEIGHHINGHIFNKRIPEINKFQELEADKFAGMALRGLGATLDETLETIRFLPSEKRFRPAPTTRMKFVKIGWNQQDEKIKRGNLTNEAHQVKKDFLNLPEEISPLAIRLEFGEEDRVEFYTKLTAPSTAYSKDYAFSKKYTEMPNFPWPPPQCYLNKTLVKNLTTKAYSFSDIDERLQRVLDVHGYHQRSYYKIPGGFALVTQMEQFRDDGGIKERARWIDYPVQEDFDGMWEYFKSLTMPKPGRFRVFVFLVSSQSYTPSEAQISQSDLQALAFKGSNQIPQKYSTEVITSSHRLDVLVYEFEAPQSTKRCRQKCPAFLDVQTHLLQSGLSNVIGF